jgi:hypothetical protein
MKYSFNKSIFILILLVVIIIIYNNYSKSFVDGFENNNYTSWSPELIRRFNIYQTKINKNENQFNLDILQKQATPEEAEELLRTGYWPWPDDLKNEYIENVWSNTIIKIDPQFALNYAMTVYNKNAARQLLAWNTKEGQFLLYGGDLGVSNEMLEAGAKDVNNTIKCTTDSNGNAIMQKKIYTGMNSWNGYMNSIVETVKPEDIPKEMPGFSFVKGACNPCVALNSPQDFSCPFKLNVKEKLPSVKAKGDDSISLPWKQLWGL